MREREGMLLGFRTDGEGVETGGQAGAPAADPVTLDPEDLTTHAVCLGATGSGKTGLCIALLEEASLAGVPVLAVDLKGDLTNLALVFPELRSEDFEPWIEADAARRAGMTTGALAQEVAERWRNGLTADGTDADCRQRLAAGREIRLYTPGSDAGRPINLVESLALPEPHVLASEEALGEAVSGTAGALLGLLGLDIEPLRSREHVLVSTVIQNAWTAGRSLDLEELITELVAPPFARIGVFEVERFMPRRDREELALSLNALIAAPGFSLWTRGTPLSVPALLGGEPAEWSPGRAPLGLVYLAHLGERERMFALASILESVVRWMRRQPGTGELRLLLYIDEVFGFLPPHPKDPPSKRPLLTLLKQARAYGVGVVLATQNPVDLDYKAMSNASTWLLGRLATEQDRARVLETLRGAGGGEGKFGEHLASLAKRHFLLHRAGRTPVAFRSRFVMSYLRGPMTRVELSRLVEARLVAGEATAPAAAGASAGAGAPGAPVPVAHVEAEFTAGSPVRPALPPATRERFLGPRAPGLGALAEALPSLDIAAPGDPPLLAPLLFARVALRFDERRLKLEHRTSWFGVGLPDAQGQVIWPDAPVDLDPELVSATPPSGARYLPLPKALATVSGWRRLSSQLKSELLTEQSIVLFRNSELGLVSAPGETRSAFAARAEASAEVQAGDKLGALRERYAERLERLEKKLARTTEKLAGHEIDLAGRKREEVLSAGESILGFVFGRRSLRGLSSASRRRRITQRSASRVDQSAGEVERLKAEMTELSEELENQAEEIEASYRDLAGKTVEIEVGLERDDVRVEQIGIFWCAVKVAGP